jgi:hypothetical protein
MVGAGKLGSAKLPMATATYPGKPSFSQLVFRLQRSLPLKRDERASDRDPLVAIQQTVRAGRGFGEAE